MRNKLFALGGATLLLGVSMLAAQAQTVTTADLPDPPKFDAQQHAELRQHLRHPGIQGAARVPRARLGHQAVRRHRQAAAGQGSPAQGADGLQDRQHARRHRRLWRRHAPRHRRPAAGLELRRRPDPGLGRHRHRHVRMSDPHRSAVRGQGRRTRADAQPRQELGLVGRRPRADHAPDRRCQMVRRRARSTPTT